ncbi:hypothetical protein A2U01_0112618, partial [Trifolium medium]|nr:hypothetical protein [Trifolium medium]
GNQNQGILAQPASYCLISGHFRPARKLLFAFRAFSLREKWLVEQEMAR